MHEGHRERIRKRLISDPSKLEDHELLEALLFFALPRVNTNPLAHEILETFGSLSGVLEAGYDALVQVEGVGDTTATLILCNAELLRRVRREGGTQPRIMNVSDFGDFLRARFTGAETEVVELYAIDKQEHVFLVKQFVSAENARAKVDASEVSRFLVSVQPYALAVAHNHPTAPARPSDEDDKFTFDLMLLSKFNKVQFLDHAIVGKDGVFSYFTSGRLQTLRDYADKISQGGKP